VVLDRLLDAPRVRGLDAFVDGECVPQVHRGLAGVAVVELAVADTFQGAGFLEGCADLGGYGERLAVMVAGLAGG
jgi:hypothetical protein